ncbi:MAG TPA: ThuA domain-containing protein, partial [Flavobacteriaceae bacterium]
MKTIIFILGLLFMFPNHQNDKVLVFTKTTGYRHESIETGVETLVQLGKQNSFEITHSEDATIFTEENLRQYKLVIFLSTTGDILNDDQQKAFEFFIKNGGNFMGIHAAADTEYDWPWYGKLVGAYFLNHPDKSNAEIITIDHKHQSSKHLPERWLRYDEWYNYKSISPDINVVLELDESTYKGGENGPNHPIA